MPANREAAQQPAAPAPAPAGPPSAGGQTAPQQPQKPASRPSATGQGSAPPPPRVQGPRVAVAAPGGPHRPPDRSYRLEPGQATAPQSPGLPRQPSRRRPTGPCSRDTTPSDRPTLLKRARASAHARMQQRRQTPCRSSTAVWLRAKHDPGAPVDKREPSRANRLLLNIMVTVLLAPVIRDRHTQNSSATS